ncbi:MAG: transporter substrate-binding domain-containing protein [Halioglobus sp.]
MYKQIRTLLLGALLVLGTALSSAAMAGDTLQRVIDFKTLKVGMSAGQPPFTMADREGKLMGFDVDLARALASAMRVKLEIKVLPFGDLLKALDEGQVDMVVSGLSITPERAEAASFIGPYMMSGKSILTKNDVLAKVSSTDQFNRADLKLAALKNSTSSDFVSAAAPQANLIEVASYDEGVEMVKDGSVDGLIADMPICVLSVLRYPDAGLVTLERPLTVEPIGIAVKGDDAQFHNLVDNYLEAYGRVGVLTKLRKKWFESNSWVAALP